MSDFFRIPWNPHAHPVSAGLTGQYTETGRAENRSCSGYRSKVRVQDRYKVVGFISSGTYGRVYKAIGINGQVGEFAIKKYVSLRCHCRSS